MITVSGKQAKEIEYLIEQSIQGHHVLFDESLLKSLLCHEEPTPALQKNRPLLKEETSAEFQHHEKLLEQILKLPTLAQKRAYLDRLADHEQEGLLRLWLNVVENSLYQSTQERH